MTTDVLPKALILAALLASGKQLSFIHHADAAAELRRLHEENEDYGATIDYLTCENAEQIGEIVALKEQRDELLEALMKLVEDLEMRSNWKCGDDKGVVDCGHSVYLKARAAISNATQGETK